MDTPPVEVTIQEVQVEPGASSIAMMFRNVGAAEVLLDPFNVCAGGSVLWPLFEIVDGSGREVEYEGVFVDRGEPDFGSFVALPAGGQMTVRCDISEEYPLSNYTPPFRVKYVADNMTVDHDYFHIESDVFTAPGK